MQKFALIFGKVYLLPAVLKSHDYGYKNSERELINKNWLKGRKLINLHS